MEDKHTLTHTCFFFQNIYSYIQTYTQKDCLLCRDKNRRREKERKGGRTEKGREDREKEEGERRGGRREKGREEREREE